MNTMTTQGADTPVIAVQGLEKHFAGNAVLRGVEWQVQKGSIVGLLGRNGAGKSTLMECLLGLRMPSAGQARVWGELSGAFSDGVRARIGYVPQRSELFDWLNARQMLDYFSRLYPRWDGARSEALLRRWEVPTDRPISQLSGGQQQRLSIIRALAHRPELLVLDEPVSSLDPAGRRDFLRELIDHVLDEETTIVFSTHILSDLERVAMQVAVLHEGRIAHEESLDGLMENSVRVSGRSDTVALLRPRKVFRTIEHGNGQTTLLAQFDAATRATLQATEGLLCSRLALEDLFIEMTHSA